MLFLLRASPKGLHFQLLRDKGTMVELGKMEVDYQGFVGNNRETSGLFFVVFRFCILRGAWRVHSHMYGKPTFFVESTFFCVSADLLFLTSFVIV